MSLNIHVNSTPCHLKVTETMICDFLMDPVLGAKVILGVTLDSFQKVRLKVCWWTPRVMDSSGLSSAKTFGMWVYFNLRCLLLPDHVCGIYYPAFETAKQIYVPYFTRIASLAPIYRANVGRMKVEGIDGKEALSDKALMKGPSCHVFSFKNGSKQIIPAPGFLQDAKTQAGHRFNDLGIDEHTKVEAMGGEGIDAQLIGRTTRHSINKNHPIFRNHHLFSGTAEDTMHPAHARYSTFVKEVRAGNPDYAVLSFNFKDYSDLHVEPGVSFRERHREDLTMKDMKLNKTRSGFLQEALGIWSKNGKGLYTGEMIEHCNQLGIKTDAGIYCSRAEDPEGAKAHYFMGIDPARAESKKADDGSIVVLRAVPLISDNNQDINTFKLSFCYAYKVRGADISQWSGIIHRKHRHFNLTGIMLDPGAGGGGNWIRPELLKTEQKIAGVLQQNVRPIATIEDEEGLIIGADYILCMFRPQDARINQTWGNIPNMRSEHLIDAGHKEFCEGLSNGIALPKEYRARAKDEIKDWTEERRWASILVSDPKGGIGAQLQQIFFLTNDDGTTLYTKGVGGGARTFSSKVRKDFAYAAMFSYMRFLVWLRGDNTDYSPSDADAAPCSS